MNYSEKLFVPLGSLAAPTLKPISKHSTSPHNLSNIRFWREFAAGMKMFTSHLGRNNADLKDIFHRNMKLLHRTLKTEEEYRQLLHELPYHNAGIWNKIASSKEMHCGVVKIDASSNTNLNNIVKQIDYFPSARATKQRLSSAEQGLLALFVINGKIQIEIQSEQKQRNQNISKRFLKSGRSCIQSINSLPQQIKALTENSQLLILAIPPNRQH